MKHQLALVTGASSGIGRALCDLLAAQGIELIINGRDLEHLDETAKALRLKVNVQVLQADLSKPNERHVVVELIRQRAPDLVINNAGLALYNDAIQYPTENQMQILEVNGVALLELTLEAAKAMKAHQKKGVILNVSSVAGFFTFPYFAVYAASKSFINTLSQSLDYELKDDGIRVLAACPGMVDTNFRVRSGGTPENNKQGLMTSAFAAEEIWKQIQTLKKVHIFNWKYRLAVLARAFVPACLYVKFLIKNIKNRCR
jgi:uncharacterized protein